jgi:hypothetical protein
LERDFNQIFLLLGGEFVSKDAMFDDRRLGMKITASVLIHRANHDGIIWLSNYSKKQKISMFGLYQIRRTLKRLIFGGLQALNNPSSPGSKPRESPFHRETVCDPSGSYFNGLTRIMNCDSSLIGVY